MRLDEMSSSQRAEQREFASHNRGSDEARKALRVETGLVGVCATHTNHLEDALLGWKDCAATNGTDFDAGHSD
jgi:hypothetical protein